MKYFLAKNWEVKMILKYDIEMDNKVISDRLQNLINQIYKLLPSR